MSDAVAKLVLGADGWRFSAGVRAVQPGLPDLRFHLRKIPKRLALLLGFSGYQPLIRAYVGQGMRVDLERLKGDTVAALVHSLEPRGVSEKLIRDALEETKDKGAV